MPLLSAPHSTSPGPARIHLGLSSEVLVLVLKLLWALAGCLASGGRFGDLGLPLRLGLHSCLLGQWPASAGGQALGESLGPGSVHSCTASWHSSISRWCVSWAR